MTLSSFIRKNMVLIMLANTSAAVSQNVGINITSPQAALDVYGDIIIRSADITVADGTTLALDVNYNRFSYYRLSGPTAAFTVAGITAGVEGRLVSFFNRSGFDMQLNNDDPAATAINRILTGTNANLIIPNKGVVNLQYDGLEQKWVVISNNKINGAAVSGGWGLNGNSGNTASNFIGNTDNVPLLIRSNNTTVGNFSANNVSIGNDAGNGFVSGINNLFLGGRMRAPLTTSNYSVAIGPDAEISADNQVIIGAPYHKTGIGLAYNESPDHTLTVGRKYSNQGALKITGTTYSSHFNYSNTEDTYIRGGKLLSTVYVNDQNGGNVILGSQTTSNVGIGTNYPPNRRLEIYKGRMLFTGAQDAANGVHPGIEFTNDAGSALRGFTGMYDDNYIGFYGYNGAGFGMVMNVTNGCVGIGTVNPDPLYKLSVNGFIRAKEIRVNTGWADYVFEKNYTLKPLKEVEQFIISNKHLPGVPDAATLQKEGVDISTMQTKMMEKIEELTLYMIEADKKIALLQQQLSAIKNNQPTINR